jgi:uncharacterized protein involved in propanediol utilization
MIRATLLRQPCHFGEWVQGRLGPEGPVVLVTLMPRDLDMLATRRPSAGFRVATPGMPAGFPAPAPTLRRFLRGLGLAVSGTHALRPAVPPGLGTGASTAALVALARLAGFRGPPGVLARACLSVEGASDPVMYSRPDRLLWASRRGQVLGVLPPLPRAQLLTGFFGPPLPTQAADQDYDDVSDLVAAWGRARALSDRAAIARDSAARCLARRGPTGDPTAHLARDLGALGWAASHSGAARALIFAPGEMPRHGAALLREAGLRGVRVLVTGG